ncbi:DUF4150 domain-containing protein [Psychrosphaera sp. B3R10]|uniref:DUF4150 domain-containing protein n=1 Tax=Psychrosphaera algicola TaxID=3023714 RepID=A0ABT5FF63_9GAMM|nr:MULTISPECIES: DUF4150 domain-containing protein [unclassified Psychrosphaera]MBU2880505.1 DUF4150 domain-containing protein [Psychrosphaera sp. I2R16]MBU2987902.1 DUF4150 domain-containing protein [Psychrosphaera sp. B3R10]MDC2890185.1 DUF4150 domain-containing protein [Psychrosphaera sp. G1-22]MDO6721409.1 DUF4150 domain-containing protein [Psychrosphaera sp. 1_MG-2023]
MVFATTQMPAMNMAFPDVCLTPIPSPVGPIPTPLPYPNIAVTAMGIPSQVKVLTLAMPNHNMLTITPMSNGDNAGLMMNPLSGMVMGPQRQLLGSVKTFIGGLPSNKMLGLSGQNGMMPGSFGATLSPSQVKVMILA